MAPSRGSGRGSAEILLFTDGMPNINPPRGWCFLCGGNGGNVWFFSENPQERNNT